MKDAAPNRHRSRNWLLSITAVLIVLFAAIILTISIGIVHEAGLQQVRPADAIVVFGAAEYSGRPSPVFKARLDHAYDIFQKGVASVVITTGGAGEDPNYSEGGVGHDYLMRRGIPENSLIAETQGADTAQSARRVAVIMRANGMKTCVAVSDEYHVFRIQKLLEHEGLRVYVAPRPGSRPRTEWQRFYAVLRESLSYLIWRLAP
jgi:uncharacterized SAM-binding protein YcdF (DUF218 family)